MLKFTVATTAAAFELQQLVAAYFAALDSEIEPRDVTPFFTADCVLEIGAISYRGHQAMRKFYAERAADVRSHKDGSRTRRHAFTNLQLSFEGDDRATLNLLNITFSGAGKPPVLAGATPTIVTDVRLECRRDNGGWLIAGFFGQPIFVGQDTYMNQTVVRGQA